jgi:hypothetical protein
MRSAAERQRRYRERIKRGVVVVPVEIIDAAVGQHVISESETAD